MTLIKTEYLAHRNAALGTPLRSWMFANLPRWTGYQRRLLRLLIGLRNRSQLLARLAEAMLGITAKAPLPAQQSGPSPRPLPRQKPRAAMCSSSPTPSPPISSRRSPTPPSRS